MSHSSAYFLRLGNIPTAVLAAATLGLIVWTKKASEPLVILGAGLIGLALKSFTPA